MGRLRADVRVPMSLPLTGCDRGWVLFSRRDSTHLAGLGGGPGGCIVMTIAVSPGTGQIFLGAWTDGLEAGTHGQGSGLLLSSPPTWAPFCPSPGGQLAHLHQPLLVGKQTSVTW